jgi:methyltransferase (TIGR00027 family)
MMESRMTTNSEKLSGVHETAFMAAALRAGHFMLADEPKIFSDEFAGQLLEMGDAEIAAFCAKVPPPLASTCVLRSRFTEDRLAAARQRLNQYVVLGAGLDSYGLRKADQLGPMIVYEVDDPPFQQWKQRRIEALGLKTPPQVRYVPCNFEEMSVADALASAGFAADEPCFISWLGVTQYLTRDAIRETLRWASERPAGSEVVLTIVDPGAKQVEGNSRRGIVEFTSYITLEEMTELLLSLGFSRVEPLSLEAAQEDYFNGRTDGLAVPPFQRSIAAIV